jgi:hypothetical protein
MPEVAGAAPSQTESRSFDASVLARLRALSRSGLDPRALLKSVTPVEISALVLLVLIVAGALVVYSFEILPDQVRYVQLSNEVSANRAKIDELQGKIVDPRSLTSQFRAVQDSLDSFRGSMLKPRRAGQLEILDAIDRATRETGVQLASSVAFKTDDLADDSTDKKKSRRRKDNKSGKEIQSYPSLGMHFSISGSYAQLRSFISRFEGSGQFVVINSIALGTEGPKGGEESAGGGRAPARRAPTPAGGEPTGPLTLEITMTAYFQPEAPAGLAQ